MSKPEKMKNTTIRVDEITRKQVTDIVDHSDFKTASSFYRNAIIHYVSKNSEYLTKKYPPRVTSNINKSIRPKDIIRAIASFNDIEKTMSTREMVEHFKPQLETTSRIIHKTVYQMWRMSLLFRKKRISHFKKERRGSTEYIYGIPTANTNRNRKIIRDWLKE